MVGKSLPVAESRDAARPGKIIASILRLSVVSVNVLQLQHTSFLRALILGGLTAALPSRAVYAPVPDQQQGKDLTVSVKAGVSYDSNLFASARRAVGSTIYTLAPRADYNASLTDQTFMSAGYGLALDKFDNRPGDSLLDSHDATLRVAHAFSKSTTLDVNDLFMVSLNPESLLAGVPLNPDQSLMRNQLDGRFETPLSAKSTATIKARSVYYKYRNEGLGRALDRFENLAGLSADYAILPEVKAAAEYRHQDVYYRKEGETKNKRSDFLMGGADYALARKLSLSGRVGAEWRQREAERDTTAPFAELSGKYQYREKAFLAAGLGYNLEEASDTARFTDTKILRLFVNVQHPLTALIVASGSVTYEPSTLQGRRGQANVDETTVRTGGALSYLPTKNWLVSGSVDYDHTNSDDATRNLKRTRAALSGTYTF